jgi:hypothetical protein
MMDGTASVDWGRVLWEFRALVAFFLLRSYRERAFGLLSHNEKMEAGFASLPY